MGPWLLQWVRRFNAIFPFHQIKPSLAKRVARWLPREPGERVWPGIAGRLRMKLDLTIPEHADVYLNVADLAMVSRIRSLLRPGDTAVDGGANVGFLTLVMAERVGAGGKVFAFEPQPASARLVRENLALNGFDQAKVIESGLWESAGSFTLYEFADGLHVASLGRRDDQRVTAELRVPTVRCDDVVEGPVRLYKLDIEGAEWHAMRGSQRLLFTPPCPHILIELNPQTCRSFGHHPLQVVDWLLQQGRHRRMTLMRRRKGVPVDRADLATLFERQTNKSHNVWFDPL
jgi:FkbM family methyltransferase